MSSIHQRDRGALVALGLLLGAVVIIAAVSGLGDILDQTTNSHTSQDVSRSYDDVDYHVWGDSWAQWAMACIALIATGVSLRGLYLLRRTFEETEATAKAAIESNDIARKGIARQLRAYITVNSGGIRVTALGHAWIGHVSIVNMGDTLATDVKAQVSAIINSEKRITNFDQTDPTQSIGVIQPGATVRKGSKQINIGERHEFVFVYGTVKYIDGFDCERWTRFCHRYSCAAIERSDNASKFFNGIEPDEARQHDAGNDAT